MNDGGLAFPIIDKMESSLTGHPDYTGSVRGGMSLRDYYFGKVLQGFCANPAIFAQNGMTGFALVNCSEETLVKYALSIADTAVSERSKQ